MITIEQDSDTLTTYGSLLGFPNLGKDVASLYQEVQTGNYNEALWLIARYFNYEAKIILSYLISLRSQDPSQALLNLQLLLNRTVPLGLSALILSETPSHEEICGVLPAAKNVESIPKLAKAPPAKIIEETMKIAGYPTKLIEDITNIFKDNKAINLVQLVFDQKGLSPDFQKYLTDSLIKEDIIIAPKEQAIDLGAAINIANTVDNGVVVRASTASLKPYTGYLSIRQNKVIVQQVCDHLAPGFFAAEKVPAGEYTLTIYMQGYLPKEIQITKEQEITLFNDRLGLNAEGISLVIDGRLQ